MPLRCKYQLHIGKCYEIFVNVQVFIFNIFSIFCFLFWEMCRIWKCILFFVVVVVVICLWLKDWIEVFETLTFGCGY